MPLVCRLEGRQAVYRAGIRVAQSRQSRQARSGSLPPRPLTSAAAGYARGVEKHSGMHSGSLHPENGPAGKKGSRSASPTRMPCRWPGSITVVSTGSTRNGSACSWKEAGAMFVFGHEPALRANHRDNLSFVKRPDLSGTASECRGRVYFAA